MNPFAQQAPIPGVKKVVLVGSGKGGVGKSTVTAHLAVALKNMGKKVGVLDADIYGPSIPRLFGALNQPPAIDENKKIHPVTRFGIRLMSMGFLVEGDQAIIWRGPMLFKAMDQFFRDVQWGELDYLLMDLPPGTGDVALTVAQKLPVHGAITVCTPQNMALIDAKKAIDMFERINVPTLGVVENMSYFKAPGSDEKHDLFPTGDLHQYLDAKQIPALGKLPFNPQLALSCEAGVPMIESDPEAEESKLFMELAKTVDEKLN